MIVLAAIAKHGPAEDVFSLRSIGVSAAIITERCVLSAVRVGGIKLVGPRSVLRSRLCKKILLR